MKFKTDFRATRVEVADVIVGEVFAFAVADDTGTLVLAFEFVSESIADGLVDWEECCSLGGFEERKNSIASAIFC